MEGDAPPPGRDSSTSTTVYIQDESGHVSRAMEIPLEPIPMEMSVDYEGGPINTIVKAFSPRINTQLHLTEKIKEDYLRRS